MNVTASQFKAYLEEFHATLEATARQCLSPNLARSLLHLSFQPCKIQGYVSTQFGVGFEYIPSAADVNVSVGSQRVEDLLFGYPGRLARFFGQRNPAITFRDGKVNARFTNCAVTGDSPPFRLKDLDSELTLVDCHFKTLGFESPVSWSKDIEFAQIFGNRSASFWSDASAVARAKDEVLAALVEVNKAAALGIPIAEYANTRKLKTVLVLGDYSNEGMARLQAICKSVADLGYEPMLVKDVPEIFGSDLQQKVMILGALARLVLIDDSSPSGHLVEVNIAQQSRWLTVLLHANGQRGSWMTAGLNNTSKIINEEDFDPLAPRAGVERAVAWAEAQLKSLERNHDQLYPWRSAERL